MKVASISTDTSLNLVTWFSLLPCLRVRCCFAFLASLGEMGKSTPVTPWEEKCPYGGGSAWSGFRSPWGSPRHSLPFPDGQTLKRSFILAWSPSCKGSREFYFSQMKLIALLGSLTKILGLYCMFLKQKCICIQNKCLFYGQ